MTELEKLQAELKALDDEAKAIQHKRGEILTRLAHQCPVKIGDVAECNGYSFAGKKMVVDSVHYYHRPYRGTLWDVGGVVLKKNGKPSKSRSEIYL